MGIERVNSPVVRPEDTVLEFPSSLARRVFLATGFSPKIRDFVRAQGFEVVHAHFSTNGWLIQRVAKQNKLPLVVTVHGHDITKLLVSGSPLRRAWNRHKVRSVFGQAARIIAVSDFVRQKALDAGADAEKVVTLYTGTPIPELEEVEKRWDVVFVGRMVEKKGVQDLLSALASPGLRNARVALIGDGPLREQLEAQAAELGLKVAFLGMIPPQQVHRELAASKLLAAPSVTASTGDTEGLPTVIVEAMALGVPVVATRHSGIPEAVREGFSGELVDEHDVAGLAQALEELINDEALRATYSANAREDAVMRFNMLRQCSLLEELYAKVSESASANRKQETA
ncbi:glycosyltransferase [Pseudoclavibacter helvolus]|uniref:Glycosyltransferase involved in cell wall biosynthesis n=1 Tax=Pseudoclavibacter helvolus TaxID=255205 RepID=A0A7W4YG86_9MICO|nr:glycosyltransferase involved in cell wall biosynthesis [Pseudoclavibacter helvolus]